MKQPLTATQTATETATVVHVFQRSGSQNYYVRFKPEEAALPLFQNRKDIWLSTGTSDKKEAEKLGITLLAEQLAKQKQYLEEFLPMVQRKFLECKTTNERTEVSMRLASGYLYDEFIKEQEILELQLKVAGLWNLAKSSGVTASRPSVEIPSEPQLQAVAPLDVATPLGAIASLETATLTAHSVPRTGHSKHTNTPQSITPEVVQKVFAFAAKVRRAGSTTEATRAREGKRLIEWMQTNKVAELTPQKAKEYTSFLKQRWAYKTASQRFSLTSYAFDIGVKNGHEEGIHLPYDPFAECGLIGAAKEGVQSPREAITAEAFRKVLANLPSVQEDPITHWAIKIAAVTGLRITALATLTREDVKREANVVCLHVSAAKKGTKTDISYWVPVHSEFAEEFFAWFESTTSKKVFNREGREISARFTRLLGKLGIKPALERNTMSFHSLRHSNASWLKDIGIPIAHANAMQGRKEGGTLGRYGSLAGVLSYAGGVINAPLWWQDDYLERLHAKASKQWE